MIDHATSSMHAWALVQDLSKRNLGVVDHQMVPGSVLFALLSIGIVQERRLLVG